MADNTNRVAGVATITVDGESFALRGEFAYRVATVDRSTIAGQDGIHGYKEMPTAGQISAQFTDTGRLDVAAINAMTNVTVIAELANGKTVIGRNMWTTGTQDVKTVDSTLDTIWEGPDVTASAV